MSNTYKLTQKIHELLPQVCEKNNIKQIEIESNFYWSFDLDTEENKKIYICEEFKQDFKASGGCLPYIQAPQLRQILVGLQGVLGIYTIHSLLDKWLNYKVWNDDVDTLFNREPLTVLTELVEILQNLLK